MSLPFVAEHGTKAQTVNAILQPFGPARLHRVGVFSRDGVARASSPVPVPAGASLAEYLLSSRSAVQGELVFHRIHSPVVLRLFRRRARLLLPFCTGTARLPVIARRKAHHRRFSSPKPPGGGGSEAHPHRRAQAASLHSAHWAGSVGKDVLVIRHRIHVVARLAGPRPGRRVWRGAGRGQRRGAAPQVQVPEDLFHHGALVNDGNDAHGKFSLLPVAASRTVKLGGTVATVGFPNIGLQGFAPKLAKGEIASLSGPVDDPRYFQISVRVQPGNSGGALVDERGNVVGVVSAKLNAAAALATSGALPENVNYAVKSSFVLSFLESVPEVSVKLKEPNTKDRKFEDVVRSAEQAAVLVLVY
jgi:hypothetical protein